LRSSACFCCCPLPEERLRDEPGFAFEGFCELRSSAFGLEPEPDEPDEPLLDDDFDDEEERDRLLRLFEPFEDDPPP